MRAVSISVGLGLIGAAAPALAQTKPECDIGEFSFSTSARPDYGFYAGQGPTQSLVSASGAFRVWYTESGSHAPPDGEDTPPAYVEQAVNILEEARDHFMALGFREPVVDEEHVSCPGHDAALDIYLYNMNGYGDGVLKREYCTVETPVRCTSFIVIENDFANYSYPSWQDGLKTVLPHEYFHAIQSSYDARIEGWFSEGGAQWAANHLYPEMPDLERFLPVFFNNPEQPLDKELLGPVPSYIYAAAIFPLFLDERFGHQVVVNAMQQLGSVGVPSTVAIDVALGAEGSDLKEAYQEFALWNSATGRRAGPAGYIEAASYPLVKSTTVAELGAYTGETLSLSAHYYEVSLSGYAVVFDTDRARNALWHVPVSEGGEALVLEGARDLSALSADEAAALELGPGMLVVVGFTTEADAAAFELELIEPRALPEPEPEPATGGSGGSSGGSSGSAGLGGSGSVDAPAEVGGSGCAVSVGSTSAPGLAWLFGAGLLMRLFRRRNRY